MKPAKSLTLCLLLALSSLTGCASLDKRPSAEQEIACQQPRTAEIPDWPDRLETFPEYALTLLGVIQEERELETVERDCLGFLAK